MFFNKEKVLFVNFDKVPIVDNRQVVEGDDKFVSFDKKGRKLTLAEHKRLYPFELREEVNCTIETTKREIKFVIPTRYYWNGADIPKFCWIIVGSQFNPEFQVPSMIHDFILEYKWDIYIPPMSEEISIADFRRLTSQAFNKALKDQGVNSCKAAFMSGAVQSFQTTLNRKEWKTPMENFIEDQPKGRS